jgi:GT2 family glycosyltransferase
VTILEGLRLGPHIAGQKILENSEGYEFVFRPDDDICCCEIPYLENLMTMIESDPGIGAVGGIYLVPHKSIQEQSFPDNISLEEKEKIAQIRWEGKDLYVNGILQNLIHTNLTPIQAHHLYSGFLYRREALESISGYFLDFSKVGHREETDTSYRMWLAGWKLYIVPASIAWHYHPWKGGIRETKVQNKSDYNN